MKKIFWCSLFLLFCWLPLVSQAQKPVRVEIYFFYEQGCPYCARAKPFLENLAQQDPQIDLHAYEIGNNQDNYQFFQAMIAAYHAQQTVSGVPAYFIGNNAFAGYNQAVQQRIKSLVRQCSKVPCISPFTKLKEYYAQSAPKAKQEKKSSSSWFFWLATGGFLVFLFWLFSSRKHYES